MEVDVADVVTPIVDAADVVTPMRPGGTYRYQEDGEDMRVEFFIRVNPAQIPVDYLLNAHRNPQPSEGPWPHIRSALPRDLLLQLAPSLSKIYKNLDELAKAPDFIQSRETPIGKIVYPSPEQKAREKEEAKQAGLTPGEFTCEQKLTANGKYDGHHLQRLFVTEKLMTVFQSASNNKFPIHRGHLFDLTMGEGQSSPAPQEVLSTLFHVPGRQGLVPGGEIGNVKRAIIADIVKVDEYYLMVRSHRPRFDADGNRILGRLTIFAEGFTDIRSASAQPAHGKRVSFAGLYEHFLSLYHPFFTQDFEPASSQYINEEGKFTLEVFERVPEDLANLIEKSAEEFGNAIFQRHVRGKQSALSPDIRLGKFSPYEKMNANERDSFNFRHETQGIVELAMWLANATGEDVLLPRKDHGNLPYKPGRAHLENQLEISGLAADYAEYYYCLCRNVRSSDPVYGLGNNPPRDSAPELVLEY